MKKKEGGAKTKRRALPLIVLVAGLSIICVILISLTQPRKYDLEVGAIAQQTITATKDVEDSVTTQAMHKAARDSIKDITYIDAQVNETIVLMLNNTFDSITQMRTLYADYQQRRIQALDESAPASSPPATVAPDASYVQRMRDELYPISDALSDEQIAAAITASDNEHQHMYDSVIIAFERVLQEGVLEEEIPRRLSAIKEERYSTYSQVPARLRPMADSITAFVLRANRLVDVTATEAERQKQADAVEPVVYKMGQNIVRNGEAVSENQLAMLDALGLIKNSMTQTSIYLYLGMVLFLFLLGLSILMSMAMVNGKMPTRSTKKALLIVTVMLISLLSQLAFSRISLHLMPLQMGVMLLAVLIGPGSALCINLLMSLAAGVLAAGEGGMFSAHMFEIMMVSSISGCVAAFMLRKEQRRSAVLFSGLWGGLAAAIGVGAIGIMTSLNVRLTAFNALTALGGGLLSAVLTMGFVPLLELLFGVMTQQKLLELSNPNQPLLRMLQDKAPGTYHHSILVANLSEAAADQIGANALLCRVGAYYHDIGKTRRPIFFKENQLDEYNPHDEIDPEVSAAILASHVRDGVIIAEKEKLPRAIIDIIQQHHGKGLMGYFFYKANKRAEDTGAQVLEEDYRYDGPIPHTKETAIVSLADTTEAAVRSLPDHSSESIQAMINKMISERMQSGELADAPLTMADLAKIEQAFQRVLGGIYHTRVEYPDLSEVKRGISPSQKQQDLPSEGMEAIDAGKKEDPKETIQQEGNEHEH